MKLLSVFVCLVAFPWAISAGDSATPAPKTPPIAPQTQTQNQNQEPETYDPFAAEDEKAKPRIKVSDPLEPMNRAFFKFNDKLYFWVLKPVAKGYKKVAPQPVRVGIRRVFTNLKFPVRFVNNLLQGKFKRAGIETARFVVNSTVGVAGFFDPAGEELKLQLQPADFDQTLGVWNFPTCMYFDWPFLGPSSVRGTFGMAGDAALSPWPYLDGIAVSLTVRPYETINDTSLRLGDYESFKKGALDPYISMRDAYFEYRRHFVEQSRSGTPPPPVEWSVHSPSAKAAPPAGTPARNRPSKTAHKVARKAPPPAVEWSVHRGSTNAPPAQATENFSAPRFR